jgi:hypothetical protein
MRREIRRQPVSPARLSGWNTAELLLILRRTDQKEFMKAQDDLYQKPTSDLYLVCVSFLSIVSAVFQYIGNSKLPLPVRALVIGTVFIAPALVLLGAWKMAHSKRDVQTILYTVLSFFAAAIWMWLFWTGFGADRICMH